MDLSLINTLEKNLNLPLPGIDIQADLSPVDHRKYLEESDDHKVASVMVLLYPNDKEWNVCYIQRATHNTDDRHAGQISFPGGKYEDSDPTLKACALRETYEEVGINPSHIHVLGQLSELYISVSNFKVYPFVGFMEKKLPFIIQESEVKSVIEVPLTYLNHSERKKKGDIKILNYTRKDIP